MKAFWIFWRVFTKKHLAASPLPPQMVGVVNIADETRLFKANNVPVFVSALFVMRVSVASRFHGYEPADDKTRANATSAVSVVA